MAAGRLTWGRHSYGSPTVTVYPCVASNAHVGAFCSVAGGVELLLGGNHRPDWVSTYPFRVLWELPDAWIDGHPRPESDIVIGNDVWIGADALILPGTTVGDGAVIGARAVVSGVVAPYAVVAGNPATERRRRFSAEQITALLDLRWWDWPDEEFESSFHCCVPMTSRPSCQPRQAPSGPWRGRPEAGSSDQRDDDLALGAPAFDVGERLRGLVERIRAIDDGAEGPLD